MDEIARRLYQWMQVGGLAPGIHPSGDPAQPYRGLVNSIFGSRPTPAEPTRPAPTETPDVGAGEAGGLPPSVQALLDRMRQNAPTVSTPRPASPVLTPGAVAQPPVESPQASATNTDAGQDSQQAPSDGRSTLDRIQDFGYAMAASRNPSLFGMIGDAGLAMRQGDQQGRREALQARELDTTQEYRRAQIALAQAEANWNRDPNNPLNVARLAQARMALASAARAGSGGGGGSSNDGPGIPIEQDGRFGIFYPRSGRMVSAPEGVRPLGATANTPEERRATDWQNRRAAAVQALVSDPLVGGNEAEVRRRIGVWESANPRPSTVRGGGGAGSVQPNNNVAAPPRRVYDANGRPIQ